MRSKFKGPRTLCALGILSLVFGLSVAASARQLFPDQEEFFGKALVRGGVDMAGSVMVAIDVAGTNPAIDRIYLFTPSEPAGWLEAVVEDAQVSFHDQTLRLSSEAQSLYLELSMHPAKPSWGRDSRHHGTILRSYDGLGLVRYGKLRASLDELTGWKDFDITDEAWRLYAPPELRASPTATENAWPTLFPASLGFTSDAAEQCECNQSQSCTCSVSGVSCSANCKKPRAACCKCKCIGNTGFCHANCSCTLC